MKSKITLFFTILICFLLQSTVISRIAIGSITPNLILILCISMGLMRGRKSGMWTGFFCGFLVDMFYGSVFGFYALIYMYIGFLSGYAHRICYDDDVKVPIFLAGAGDILYGLAVYALQFLLRGRTWTWNLSQQDHFAGNILYDYSDTDCLSGFLLYQLSPDESVKERK